VLWMFISDVSTLVYKGAARPCPSLPHHHPPALHPHRPTTPPPTPPTTCHRTAPCTLTLAGSPPWQRARGKRARERGCGGGAALWPWCVHGVVTGAGAVLGRRCSVTDRPWPWPVHRRSQVQRICAAEVVCAAGRCAPCAVGGREHTSVSGVGRRVVWVTVVAAEVGSGVHGGGPGGYDEAKGKDIQYGSNNLNHIAHVLMFFLVVLLHTH